MTSKGAEGANSQGTRIESPLKGKQEMRIKTETMNLQPDHLGNELVQIVPLKPADFDRLFQVASDPLIWEQHPANDRYQKAVFQQFFAGAIESGSAFLVIDKKTGEPIGSTRFYDYDAANSSIAIGFTFLAREFWGGEYNRSIKALLLDYAFQFVDTVVFHIGITNLRSQKAIEKMGAVKIGEMDLDFSGQKAPHFEYAIKRNDWLRGVGKR